MEILQLEKLIDSFIQDNDLVNNSKNKTIIKMALKSPRVQELKGKKEIFEYLKKKFMG